MKRFILLSFVFILFLAPGTPAQDVPTSKDAKDTLAVKENKRPVIFIPGILGSRLVNSETGESVWVNMRSSKDDDLRLPMSPNLAANKDKLVANQVLQRIKILKYLPQISVYQGAVDFLEKAGYKKADWDHPTLDGALGDRDTYYLFAYDWRRDNVESARKLLEQIDALRRKLNKPDLKFDVVAHSMGGLVARYAAMYGKAELTDNIKPNWDGIKYFHKIFLTGTPNDGSMEALDTVLVGYTVPTIAGRRKIGVLNREVALTAPSLFQLLPHGDSLRFYDEDLKPLKLDIYDPLVWKKYKWSAAFDPAFMNGMTKAKAANVEKYFAAALNRAKKFHVALAAQAVPPPAISFYTYGSDCKTTLDGAIIHKDPETNEWMTLTRGSSYKNSRGEKVSEDQVKKLIFTMGDGTVTKASLIVEALLKPENTSGVPFFACEAHASLLSNKLIQESFLGELFRD
jgi:pimeloyl-ACP methyl ester carboxylesterase